MFYYYYYVDRGRAQYSEQCCTFETDVGKSRYDLVIYK